MCGFHNGGGWGGASGGTTNHQAPTTNHQAVYHQPPPTASTYVLNRRVLPAFTRQQGQNLIVCKVRGVGGAAVSFGGVPAQEGAWHDGRMGGGGPVKRKVEDRALSSAIASTVGFRGLGFGDSGQGS